MTTFTMTLDGHPAAGEKTFGVINPATGSVFAEAPECSKPQLDSAMDAAGPALNPMIKVVNLVSVIIAPIVVTFKETTLPVIIAGVILLAALAWAVMKSKRQDVSTA